MESLLFAINAILPIILIVAVGYFLKRVGLLTQEFAKMANKLVFRVFLPVMLFLNVYKLESFGGIGVGFVLYAVGALLIIFLAGIPSVILFTKDAGKRGALLQGIFRSNYALIGIPLAVSLFGDDGAAVASVLAAVVIPVFNILAVISLSVFSKGGEKPSVRRVLRGIVTNPLILSVSLGFVALGIRALLERHGLDWRLTDLAPLYSAMSSLGSLATPLALLMLGAQFEFSAIRGEWRELLFGVLARCAVVPTLALGAAYIFFRDTFTGAHFAAFVAMFATPIAVSSVPMAQEMGADSALAGRLVVSTTLLSAFTVFAASLIFKAAGIF